MAYRIITDTCCDYPQEMYEQLQLIQVPLSITFRGKEYSNFTEAQIKEVYDGLRNGEAAQTSAVNPDTWAKYMEPTLAAGDDLLALVFSSGLSTTYQSARIAAEELKEKYPERKIAVVDTLCASMGQGLLVYYACKKRDEGMDLETLTAWCEVNKLNLCHWFTVDDLMYLKRGGRVSAATALLGTMLQIKPVLHVDDEGHLIKVGAARGRKGALEALIQKVEQTALPGENDIMFVSHGDCLEEAEHVAQLLKERCGAKEVVVSYVGAVIGSHSGPGTMAVFFMGKQR